MTDMIAEYTGQSETKTRKELEKGKGGVIFIDEAYSITRSGDSRYCSFGMKVLDVINQFMSEHPETIIIIAGYKDLIEKNVLKVNEGLARRFPWKFDLSDYSSDELFAIFESKINESGYKHNMSNNEIESFKKNISQNKDHLKYNGGDMVNILTKAMTIHCKSILSIPKDLKTTFTYKTLNTGLDSYIEHLKTENVDKELTERKHFSMYR